MKANLYKCFIPQAWELGQKESISGFVHPEGVYDDPNGGFFREEIYPRLRYHFQFQNELKLFSDIGNREKFSLNIFSNLLSNTFSSISNLFHPNTIDQTFSTGCVGKCGGIKNDADEWNLLGHNDRLVLVDKSKLEIFAKVFNVQGTPPLQACLPVIHSRQVVDVLLKFASIPIKFGNSGNDFFSTQMWNEVNAQTDGTMSRNTNFPDSLIDWIISGPHFHICKPFHQTPKAICETHRAYDNIDLSVMPDNYLPRTNYIPSCDLEEYNKRTPKVTWGNKCNVTEYFRLVHRRMLSQAGERTIIVSILPKFCGAINTCVTTVFEKTDLLLQVTGLMASLPYDFIVKTTGRADLYGDSLAQFPLVENKMISFRALLLVSLTSHYEELWQESWDENFQKETWAKNDTRLDNLRFTKLASTWHHNHPLRTDYERRQALVEIDALVAIALGLTLDELCTIYRIQFPVLRQNENDTWYDQNGRIVFTCSKGLPGVGFSRAEWNEIKDMKSGTVSRTITDDTMPSGPVERTITYVAPFDKCDREEDYRTVWAEFERRFKA